MRMIVKSLKRLYEAGRLTKEQIKDRVCTGTITEEEYKEIIGEDYEV